MLSKLFGAKSGRGLRLVIALNGVDKIGPGNWNEEMNAPSHEQEASIRGRIADITKRLVDTTPARNDQIEYYSALRRYRLINLLAAVIRNTKSGFRLDSVNPRDPFELASPEVKAFANEERQRRAATQAAKAGGGPTSVEELRTELRKHVAPDVLAKIEDAYKRETTRPAKVAIFGKSGVGKTTTINNLFNAQWRVSHTVPGTTNVQIKEFDLATGGTITIVDLPGFGRSIKEDKHYEGIYKDVIPSCDVVLWVMQANTRDISDDQEMIDRVAQWLDDSATDH